MSDISSDHAHSHKTAVHPTNDEEKTVDGKHAREEFNGDHELEYDVHDAELSGGVAKVEAASLLLGRKGRICMWIALALAVYIYSLDGTTTYLYLAKATSVVFKHSLLGTISTAGAIIIAVGKPLMAKLADYIGRGETFIVVTVFYCVGYILYATANDVYQIAGGQIIYSFGYTGLQLLTQVLLADTTTLQYRGLAAGAVTMPFVINAFVAAEIANKIIGDVTDTTSWRWGYGMFALAVPVCLLPIVVTLLWGQHKARKAALLAQAHNPAPRVRFSLKWLGGTILHFVKECDALGLILVAAALALILLPLGLAKTSSRGWQTPSMIVMIVIGCVVALPALIVWELFLAERFGVIPIAPKRFFKNRNISAACAIGFCDFVSFYLQYTYQYSFITVVKTDWSVRVIGYFMYTQTIALCVFGLLAGIIMAYTKRLKLLLVVGLCIRLIGVGIMIHSKGALGSDAELVMAQILQGVGGGFAAIIIQTAAQSRVAHVDVAIVTALVLLITEVGNSVGSAVATAVWTSQMPQALARYVPTDNTTLLAELYGSIYVIAAYPAADPVRTGAIEAYGHVMKNLCIGATVVAILPPLIAYFFIDDVVLDDRQNALDDRGLDGKRREADTSMESADAFVSSSSRLRKFFLL